MQKYTSLDNVGVSWFFDDPVVSKDDLKSIRAFSSEYSFDYWTHNICPERHLMLDANLDQRFSFKKAEYCWENDWNSGNINGLPDFLKKHVDLLEDEIIVYFWSRGCGVETTWGVFLRNWINFLFEDEAPILLCPCTRFSVMFGPGGYMLIGSKNSECTD